MRFDPQLSKQSAKVRISSLIEDDEAGIDREFLIAQFHFNRVGVPPQSRFRFEQSHVVALCQCIGCSEASDPGTYYSDAHMNLINEVICVRTGFSRMRPHG
jgi:hypothetical protein